MVMSENPISFVSHSLFLLLGLWDCDSEYSILGTLRDWHCIARIGKQTQVSSSPSLTFCFSPTTSDLFLKLIHVQPTRCGIAEHSKEEETVRRRGVFSSAGHEKGRGEKHNVSGSIHQLCVCDAFWTCIGGIDCATVGFPPQLPVLPQSLRHARYHCKYDSSMNLLMIITYYGQSVHVHKSL